jgi:hypothetical protein
MPPPPSGAANKSRVLPGSTFFVSTMSLVGSTYNNENKVLYYYQAHWAAARADTDLADLLTSVFDLQT